MACMTCGKGSKSSTTKPSGGKGNTMKKTTTVHAGRGGLMMGKVSTGKNSGTTPIAHASGGKTMGGMMRGNMSRGRH